MAAASMRTGPAPAAASGWSRCAAARGRSAPSSPWSAPRVAEQSSGSSCPPRACEMASEIEERIRVLVVDDHEVVRRGLFAFLEGEEDIEVVGDAESGETALEVLAVLDAEGRRPHVVLMDMKMEPVDGIESTRRIRSRYDDVEVVALTSFGDEQRVYAAVRAGASG